MLFKITEGDFFEDNPDAISIPEFSFCNSKEMKWVCMVFDYKSPIRQMPIDKRMVKAAYVAGYKNVPDNAGKNYQISPKLSRAISVYKEIQFDEDQENLLAYNSQLSQYRELLTKREKSDKEIDQSLKIMKEMPTLQAKRKELISILDLRDEIVIEEKDPEEREESLSTLDIINMEEYDGK